MRWISALFVFGWITTLFDMYTVTSSESSVNTTLSTMCKMQNSWYTIVLRFWHRESWILYDHHTNQIVLYATVNTKAHSARNRCRLCLCQTCQLISRMDLCMIFGLNLKHFGSKTMIRRKKFNTILQVKLPEIGYNQNKVTSCLYISW